MHVAVIGAGPAGLLTAIGLARRGHDVAVVDRDPGPGSDDTWRRRGVMQFHHAHAFRPQVAQALLDEAPVAHARLVEAGVELGTDPRTGSVVAMRCRRATFETALRSAAVDTPGVHLVAGHVDAVSADEATATGLVVDGVTLPADLVVDASGRSGRVTRRLRAAPTAGSACGIAYVDRQYQLLPGATPGPLSNPVAWGASPPGYEVIVFPHELGTFSVLVIRPTDDRDLVALRHDHVFEAACAAIPGLREWTDPERSRPLTPVLPGGQLMNWYRPQLSPDGGPALRGLVVVGDGVCTTTPNFGRGITTTVMQVCELLRLLDEDDTDLGEVARALDRWCDAVMRPWVVDHDRMNGAQHRRWAGDDVDLGAPLPSDLVMAAAAVDPTIGRPLGPYLAMEAGPDSLEQAQPLAQAVYESGWRPPPSPGPTRTELGAVVARALVAGP